MRSQRGRLRFEWPSDACQWHLGQHFQSIDQTVALEGLSKALFLNLCWQAMTWWRRGFWIDCVLSRSHSHFPLPLSSPLPLCPITLCLLSLLPPSPASFFLPSFSTHRLDVSSTRCQIISQQTLRCVTEDRSCISLDDTSSASLSPPPHNSLRRQHQISPGLFDHLKGLY